MVFVFELFLTSILIMLTLTLANLLFINVFFENKHSTTLKYLSQKYVKENLNSVYITLIVCLLLLQIKSLTWAVLVLFVVSTYFQPFVWVDAVEQIFLNLEEAVRIPTIDRLLLDNCVLTFYNILSYIRDLLRSEYLLFQSVYESSVMETKLMFGIIEPSGNPSERTKQLYKKYQKMFLYKSLTWDTKFDQIKDESEFLRIYNKLLKLRDPTVKFNIVSHLPIKLIYQEDESIFAPKILQSFVVFYNFFKTTIIALTLSIIYLIYTVFFFKIQFLKQLSVWFVIGMLYFWLMSGFNFFVKRYQYGKFTSQIQRFWKRTNTCFWLIEGFLLLLFFYYYLNSSQEPLYMYDYSAINQEFLVSLQTVFVNIVLLSVVIYFMYFVLLRINSNSWNQLNLYLIVISVFIFFSFFLETYQFYYVISSFNERLWVFNEDENLWVIDIENPILRTKHQYLFVCLIAKYWHFLFIFLSWVFFLIKSFERRKVTYVLFGTNLQNIVLLYVLNLACYLQWFKWLYRRFFDLPYTWFFTNIDNKSLFRIFAEIKLLVVNLVGINNNFYKFNSVIYKSLNIWNVDSLSMWKFM
jgi:hypothetical protein